MYRVFHWILGCIPLLGITSGAWATEDIVLNYHERPPYAIAEPDDSAYGVTATPAGDAFKRAGIAFRWAKMPSNRQIILVEKNSGRDCAVGWFKTPEREAFALFTKPIYRDRPWVALAPATFSVRHGMELSEVLADKTTRLLVRDRYSYGAYIDDLVKRLQPTTVVVTVESQLMIRMLRAGRADITFVPQEEADYLVKEVGLASSDIKVIGFPDIPQGEFRYIMCSKRVGSTVIERLNQAISFP